VTAQVEPITETEPRATTSQVLRICHIISGDLWAGAEIQVAGTAAFLADQPSVQLHAVLFNDGQLAGELRRLGVPVTIIDETRTSIIGILRQLTRFLEAYEFDVVHTHKYKDGVLGAIAATYAGVPHVVRTIHGLSEPFAGWQRLKSWLYETVDRIILQHCADLVIAVSTRMAEMLRESGFRPTMVTCIHNGVDLREVRATRSREEVRDELGIAPEAVLIGTAGRLSPIKGHAGLLRAAKLMLRADSLAKFLIVGDGPLREQLTAQAAELHMDGACRFLGTRTDVYDLVSAMDIFVLPSLNEGIPMALLEAMALGKPVVAADVGGIPEVVRHGVNGVLVPAGDDRALADACLELARNPQWAHALGARARRTIADIFSRDRSGETLLLAYRSIALFSGGRVEVQR